MIRYPDLTAVPTVHPAQALRVPPLVARWLVVAAVIAVLVLVLIEHRVPDAGLWLLLALSTTAGFAHGALDIDILLQRFRPLPYAIGVALLYAAVVVLVAWALHAQPQVTLWLLLLLSSWHFGEDFGRWPGISVLDGWLTRVVVGGASVMLPLVVSPDAMGRLVAEVWPDGAALTGWVWLTRGWLLLLVVWLVRCGLRNARLLRGAWAELAGALLLNVVFSPVMAFAIYFGMYHAPLHIWRVWGSRPAAPGPARQTGWAIVFAITLGLGAALWWALGRSSPPSFEPAFALRWLVLALTALTVPHLVLISLHAGVLATRRSS